MKFTKLLFILILFPIFSSFAQDDNKNQDQASPINPIVESYNQQRNESQIAIDAEQKRFDTEKSTLEKELLEITNTINDDNKKIGQLRDKHINQSIFFAILNAILATVVFFIAPLVSVFSLFSSSLSASIIVLPLLINLYIYLWIKERPFMSKHKIVITIVMLTALLSMSSTVVAQETDREKELKEALILTHEVMTLTEHQRYIKILEDKVTPFINIPELPITDNSLYLYSPVTIDSAEYYFTLAALYNQVDKKGKATETLNKLGSGNNYSYNPDNINDIVLNSIKFLFTLSQQKAIGDFVDTWASKMNNTKAKLELYQLLTEQNMQASAEKVLQQAINDTNTLEGQLELTDFFMSINEADKASESLNYAIELAKTKEDIIVIIRSAIKHNKDLTIKSILDRYNYTPLRKEDHIQLIDVFLQSNRNEYATNIFSSAIKTVERNDSSKEDVLFYYTEQALERKMLEQAISAVTRLSVFLNTEAFNYTFDLDYPLESKKGIPSPNNITLPIYDGLLNEELGFNDRAETMYEITVLQSLKSILKDYGYKTPDTLNEYYLLGRVWTEKPKLEELNLLNQVFTILEQEILKRKVEENDLALQNYRDSIADFKEQHRLQLEEIDKLNSKNSSIFFKLFIKAIGILAMLIVLIGAIVGCAIKAKEYTKIMEHNKAFAFISKFIEMTGWLRVMSIFGILSGLISVFFGQAFQIFQRMQTDIYNRNTKPKNTESSEIKE